MKHGNSEALYELTLIKTMYFLFERNVVQYN